MRRIQLPDDKAPQWPEKRRVSRWIYYAVIVTLGWTVGFIMGTWPAQSSPSVSGKWLSCGRVKGQVLDARVGFPHSKEAMQESQDPIGIEMEPGGHEATQLPLTALEELHHALETMQSQYFEIWIGTWPYAIDWTAAVMGTFVAATLTSLSQSSTYLASFSSTGGAQAHPESWKLANEINRYFSQSVGYYFGQNDFAIRLQANDDMLWVVLGWLENIKFVQVHDNMHYKQSSPVDDGSAWYGQQFVPSFAHRTRLFHDLASRGWTDDLCGGGMKWDNHGLPYKNAITNELYVSASVGMYLYFPGDSNDAPFPSQKGPDVATLDFDGEDRRSVSKREPYDRVYLSAAIKAYDWLRRSNMTNAAGLYVDGFHIHGYGVNGTAGTGKCDERNEMVYTYNQGVLLSGLRGLWEATGNISYLEDGHQLVRNVIAATGWRPDEDPHVPPASQSSERWRWRGLGRVGVLEDACDASSDCNQDGQMFKGIFFHHLTLFCEALPTVPKAPGYTYGAEKSLRMMHRQSCKEYSGWVTHNAKAALNTRDKNGIFGMWWTIGAVEPYPAGVNMDDHVETYADRVPKGATDALHEAYPDFPRTTDPNDRGLGRSVETQGSGVAVLRAMWELLNMKADDEESY